MGPPSDDREIESHTNAVNPFRGCSSKLPCYADTSMQAATQRRYVMQNAYSTMPSPRCLRQDWPAQ